MRVEPDSTVPSVSPEVNRRSVWGGRGLTFGPVRQGEKGFGSRVRICLLGEFEAWGGRLPLALSMGAKRLIAFLAVKHQPMQRQYLASSMWLEHGEENAQACLRSTLWRIRRQPYPIVHIEDGLASLAPGVSVDLHEAISLAQQLLATPELVSEAGSTGSLFVEDLLPGWPDDWLVVDREQFRQLRLHVLEVLSRRWTSAGRFAEAIEAALRAISVDPLRESAHRALIGAHLAEGNFAEAIRSYERFRTLLWEELEVQPSARMEELIATTRSEHAHIA